MSESCGMVKMVSIGKSNWKSGFVVRLSIEIQVGCTIMEDFLIRVKLKMEELLCLFIHVVFNIFI